MQDCLGAVLLLLERVLSVSSTLLFGNGFNRISNASFDWESLVMQGFESPPGDVYDLVPLPLITEAHAAIAGNMIGMRNKDGYKEFREKIQKTIDEAGLQPNEIHSLFRSLSFSNFITTNYDDCFERARDGWVERKIGPAGYRNILNPVGTVDGRPLYHAHGRHKWSRTICVSYEHYMSLIGKIQSELRKGLPAVERKDVSSYQDVSDVDLLEGYLRCCNAEDCIWPTLLFTSDVHIVGLGLSFSEIDLWWLLSMRAAYFAPKKQRRSLENSILYYDVDIGGAEAKAADRAKRYMLGNLGVEVVTVSAEDYKEGYKTICSMIEARIG